jgi:hypothetical protein
VISGFNHRVRRTAHFLVMLRYDPEEQGSAYFVGDVKSQRCDLCFLAFNWLTSIVFFSSKCVKNFRIFVQVTVLLCTPALIVVLFMSVVHVMYFCKVHFIVIPHCVSNCLNFFFLFSLIFEQDKVSNVPLILHTLCLSACVGLHILVHTHKP